MPRENPPPPPSDSSWPQTNTKGNNNQSTMTIEMLHRTKTPRQHYEYLICKLFDYAPLPDKFESAMRLAKQDCRKKIVDLMLEVRFLEDCIKEIEEAKKYRDLIIQNEERYEKYIANK